MRKYNVDYEKKYGFTYRKAMKLDIDELQKLNKETLRKYLVVMNQESNRRLESFAQKPNYLKNTKSNVVLQRVHDGIFERFSTRPHMTKKEIVADIIKRGRFLESDTSTISGTRKNLTKTNIAVREYLENIGVPSRYITKGTVTKWGKLMDRLRDNNKLNRVYGDLYYQAGQSDLFNLVVNGYKDEDGKIVKSSDIDVLYSQAVKKLTKAEKELQKQRHDYATEELANVFQ